MKRLCTICARGGSKGVKGKNIRNIAGKPLIAHTVEQALESNLFEALAVSSDSDQILKAAENAGAHILIKRPSNLASDQAAKVPAITHCMIEAEKQLNMECDVLVDLDATSPLRTSADIVGAVSLLESQRVSNVITGTPAHRSPYFNLVERDTLGHIHLSKSLEENVVRRQDAPECFDMNASIYVWQRAALLEKQSIFYPDTLLYEMPVERSFDIDCELDFDLVEFLMMRSIEKRKG